MLGQWAICARRGPFRPATHMVAMRSYLDFEKPLAELEAKIEELRAVQADGGEVQVEEEILALEARQRRRSGNSTKS